MNLGALWKVRERETQFPDSMHEWPLVKRKLKDFRLLNLACSVKSYLSMESSQNITLIINAFIRINSFEGPLRGHNGQLISILPKYRKKHVPSS